MEPNRGGIYNERGGRDIDQERMDLSSLLLFVDLGVSVRSGASRCAVFIVQQKL